MSKNTSNIPEIVYKVRKTQLTDSDSVEDITHSYYPVDTKYEDAYVSENYESQKLEDQTISKSLNLSNKRLKTLPVIKHSHIIEEVNLSNNRLSTLPENIKDLISLSELNLSNNQIETIPDFFKHLNLLKNLNLNSNRLNSVSNWISTLKHIHILSLNDNQLSKLSNITGNLKHLKELYVSNNKLKELPSDIGDLQQLTKLYIENNELSKIPESLLKLQNIRILNISDNNFENFPIEITHLNNLTHLYFNNNQIKKLPESIGHLKHLTTLSLDNNQLMSLPESIGELNNLITLNLENNQLTSLPESIGNLKHLKTLALKDNQLNQLPDTIAKLKNLTKLNLVNNDLKIIPESLGILFKSPLILIRENPYSLPPKELLEEKPDAEKKIWIAKAIRDYYQENKTDTVFVFEANLLVVGEDAAVNEFMLKFCTQSEAPIQNSSNTWTFQMENEKLFKVNIITSGYHDVYYSKFRFLLSQYSLCILLTDNERKVSDFSYWQNALNIFNFNTPLFIVINEKNDRYQDIPAELLSPFPNIKDVISINCKTQQGVSQLQEQIKKHIVNLPHIATALNQSWNIVRQQLIKENSPMISYEKLVEYFISNGIEDNKQRQVSECLHAIGSCLHFQHDSVLSKFVFLSLDWCSAAAYKLFCNKMVTSNFGLFTLSDIDKIWDAKRFNQHHNIILLLMKKLKLCYEIVEKKGTFIAPHLLSPFQPIFEQWDDNNNDIFIYQYSYMPPEFITRVITDMYSFNYKNEYIWQYGMILNENNTFAELVVNVAQKELRLKMSGKNKKTFITVLKSKLNEIHKAYKNLNCIENSYTNDTIPMNLANRSLMSAPITKYNPSQRTEIVKINSGDQDQAEQYHQLNDLLSQAINYEKNEKFDESIKQCKKIIDINEFFIPAWQVLENNYKKKGDFSKTETSATLKNLVEIFDFEKNVDKNIRLNSIELENLSFFDNFKWSFAQMNVLLGRNGYGKTHLLRFIVSLLQKDPLSAKYFEGHKQGAFSEISVEKENIKENLIKRSKNDFDETIGKVPLLAIPDVRYIDKSIVIRLQGVKLDYFRDLAAYHFLHQQSYFPVIENFLLDLCTIYLDNGKTFETPLFKLLENVMKELTEDEFSFESIKYGADSTFTFKVITEGSNDPVPIQMISQGTFSLLSIFGIIYKYLQSVYQDVPEDQLLEKRAIVFIDEIDAHLHPVWHQRIIRLLRNNFPNVQFFVSAHSPLIVAGCLRGEVSVLRKTENKLFKIYRFEKDFIGNDPLSIFKEIFEIEKDDESYRYYSAYYPFRSEIVNKIEELKKKELTYQDIDKLNRFKELLYYIERTREKQSEFMNDEKVL